MLAHLDPEHLQVIMNALSIIIATERAENLFAQLVDAVPTRSTFEEHFRARPLLDCVLKRDRPSEESTQLVKAFIRELDISSLHLDSKIIQLYQNAPTGSRQFELRFFELLAVAVHSLAGTIYSMSHSNTILHPEDPGTFQPPHFYLDFYHQAYCLYQDYPDGVLNMLGYWMETMIFGGVVLVEHDEFEREAQNIFIHSQWSGIFQLSESQIHKFFQLFYYSGHDEPAMATVEVVEGILPFQPEKGVRSLVRNQLQPSHVFHDQFSRIYPFWPVVSSIRCVHPRTDEESEIIKRGLELTGMTNLQAPETMSQTHGQANPHQPDSSSTRPSTISP